MAEDRSKHSALDPHLQERPQKEHVIPYLDALFRQAAIKWLIATDQVSVVLLSFNMLFCLTIRNYQPLQALEHPKLKEMINVAS